MRTLLLPALLPILSALGAPLVNGGFDDDPAFAGWVTSGAVARRPGLTADSLHCARLTGGVSPVQQIGQNVSWGADWWLECRVAITNAGANRAFNLMINATVSAGSNSQPTINLRHQSGQWNTFAGGAWSGDLGLGALLPSVDANGDGDLNDPGDTRHVYLLRVTGHDWGTASARYDLSTSEANGSTFTRTVTNQTRFQVAGATTSPPISFLFTTAFGANPGFWVDGVTCLDDTLGPPADLDRFTAAPAALAPGGSTTLSWSVSAPGPVTLSLSPGGAIPAGVTSTNLSPAATTTYTLTATSAGGSVSSAFTVAVGESSGPLRIPEFMAVNQTTIEDEDGEDSDWIEIHNPNPHSVDLAGYALTDDPDLAGRWAFPPMVMDPGAYLLVWASGKDRAVAGSPLHTNFQLASGGEYLGLRGPGGLLQQEYAPAFPPQTPDVSFGDGGYLSLPTPGAANLPGPFLHDARDEAQPDGSRQVSLRVENAVSAALAYRVMFGAEVSLPLSPDPDGRFRAVIPAGVAAPGEMLRWRFTATDAAAVTRRLPAFATPDAPAYLGTVMPDPGVTSALPVIQWFLDPALFAAADTTAGAPCAVFFLGELYDNARVSLRGATTALLEKKPHKFTFHASQYFRFDPALPRVDEINLNAAYTDNTYLRDWLARRDMAAAGVPAPHVAPVRLQRNGAFHSLAVLIENIDSRFLRRHGLDDNGPLFKATGNGSWLASTSGFETRNGAVFSDLQALVDGVAPGNPGRAAFLHDRVDLPNLVSYLAANALGSIYNPQKNYYVHLDLRRGEWMLLPWDRDFAYGDIYLGAGDPRQPAGGPSTFLVTNERIEHGASDDDHRDGYNRIFDAAFAVPAVREMVYRRLRTLLDGPFAPGGVEQALDAIVPAMVPEAELDRAAWGFTAGMYRNFGVYPFTTAVERVRTQYLPQRRAFLLGDGGSPARGLLPAAQPAHPPLAFGAIEFNPASGDQDQEYVELVNPNPFAVDISGWSVEGAVAHILRPGTVIPAGGSLFLSPKVSAFRARTVSPRAGEERLVQGDVAGHLSNFGETLRLREPDGTLAAAVTYAGEPSDLQRWLVITELHPAPADPHPDAEFIEVANLGTNLTLDLAGAAFTAGVDFIFPPGITLDPGERALVVLSETAFAAAFPGSGARIAGAFASGRLANSGERIKLDDAGGSTIADFTYAPAFPWPALPGHSLTYLPGAAMPRDLSASEWRASVAPGGTPGGSDGGHWNGALPVLTAGSADVFRVTFAVNADDIRLVPEFSPDLLSWTAGDGRVSRLSATRDGGAVLTTYRVHLQPGETRGYARIRLEPR